jgi:hypothetical protein
MVEYNVRLGSISEIYDDINDAHGMGLSREALHGVLSWVLLTFHSKRAKKHLKVVTDEFSLSMSKAYSNSLVFSRSSQGMRKHPVLPHVYNVGLFLKQLVELRHGDDTKEYKELCELSRKFAKINVWQKLISDASERVPVDSLDVGEYRRDLLTIKDDKECRATLSIISSFETCVSGKSHYGDSWECHQPIEAITPRYTDTLHVYVSVFDKEDKDYSNNEICGIPLDESISNWKTGEFEDRLQCPFMRLRLGDKEFDIDVDAELKAIGVHLEEMLKKVEHDFKMSLLQELEGGTLSEKQRQEYEKDLLTDEGRAMWDRFTKSIHEKLKGHASDIAGYCVYNNLMKTMNVGEDDGDS